MKPEDFLRKDYGGGCYRRHIHFDLREPGLVRAALEDEAHAFQLDMQYAQGRVTAMESKWHRYPTTTCGGATDYLQSVVGHRLTGNILDLREATDPLENCTHFYDVTSHMAAHAHWLLEGKIEPRQFLYKMSVSDACDGRQQAVLTLDDEELQNWSLDAGVISSPADYSGRVVLKGLVGWARDNLEQEELMHALMLQKCFFVAAGRLFRMEDLRGLKCKDTMQPQGVCFASRHGRELTSERTGTRKDYSDNEEQLLKFVTD